MKPIIFGIDGTDPAWTDNKERREVYDRNFSNSFVRRICHRAGGMYERGPLLLGGTLLTAINTGIIKIQRLRRANRRRPVLLVGYSRGAAGVVVVAQQLKNASIPVKAMMLFDCVDRHMDIDSSVIPANVMNVRHARRDPDGSSRETMGVSGSKHVHPTKYMEEFFMCTHAGMGGVPWRLAKGESETELIYEKGTASPTGYDGATRISYKQDSFVSDQVWQWAYPWLLKMGFMK